VSDPTLDRRALAPLRPRDRHFADRFSYGHNPTLARQVRAAGSGRAWFEKQLLPTRIKDAPGNKVRAWYPDLWHTPLQLWRRNESGVAPAWEVMTDLGRWTMMRRVLSNRQLNEVMVEFWSNLLHVPLGDDEAWPYRVSYDATIRKHALGHFDDMLVAATTHGSMGLFLDNASSTKDAPNENLGRELLELHSVGVDAGYTENDVINSARILTGYRVDLWWPSFREYYHKPSHWTGRIRVLGFTHANRDADGRVATEKYIRYLAHHPATANRLARRLCVKFVHDNPSPGLVRTVARAYTRSGTNIKATLRAMVAHPEFASSAGEKVRMPLEETLATIRALRIRPRQPTRDGAFADSIFYAASGQGMTPYSWPAPNGFPEVNVAWSSAGRALDSFNVQRGLAQQWWPTEQAAFSPDRVWLPTLPARFDTVVDHIGRQLLGEPPNARLREGISLRTGIPLTRRVTADDMAYRTRQILMALLASPAHMTR
jgi:hypothetical protein